MHGMKFIRALLAKWNANRTALESFRQKYPHRTGVNGAGRTKLHRMTPEGHVVAVHWGDTTPQRRSYWAVDRIGGAKEVAIPEDATILR